MNWERSMFLFVRKDSMNSDRITTFVGVTAVVSGALYEKGYYVKVTGLVAAVSAAIWAFYTNKVGKTYLR